MLTVSPTRVHLGAFSPLLPERTDLTSGSTTISFLSTESDWQLRVTWIEPMRRISDGLELPTRRVAEVFGNRVPSVVTSFQPYVFESGAAGAEIRTEEWSWMVFQEAVQEYLLDSDPPGRYRTRVRFDLTGPDGSPLAPAVFVEVELDILAVALADLADTDLQVVVQFDGTEQGQGESFLFPVIVRTNAPWRLRIRSLTDGASGPAGHLPLEMVFIRALGVMEQNWQVWIRDFVPFSQQTLLLASGTGPVPFSLTEGQVQLVFAAVVPISVHSGRFELPFEVCAEVVGLSSP